MNYNYAIKKKLKSIFFILIRTTLIVGISFIIIYPLLTRLISSFMTVEDVFDLSVRFVPRNFTFYNFRKAFESMNYSLNLLRTLIFSFSIAFLQLLSCTFIGYGLARFDFKGRKLLFAIVIFMLLVPPQIIMVPLFLNFRFFNIFGLLGDTGINLLNSFWPFVLTSITGTGMRNGLFIYILREGFKNMPENLEEAAYVDGAGPFRTFFRVMLPGATSVLLVVFLFSFVWHYNDIFYSNLYFRSNPGLLSFSLRGITGEIHGEEGVTEMLRYELSLINNAGMMLFMLPLLVIYTVLQRYFIESVQRTGIVG